VCYVAGVIEVDGDIIAQIVGVIMKWIASSEEVSRITSVLYLMYKFFCTVEVQVYGRALAG
jgi:hypothetical protein